MTTTLWVLLCLALLVLGVFLGVAVEGARRHVADTKAWRRCDTGGDRDRLGAGS